MTQDGRLRRLITDEVGDCCDADVADRIDELDTLVEDGKWRYYRPTGRAERLIAALDATRGGAE